MSTMIQCDGCKALMFDDSRSEKGDYHEIWIDRSDSYHLCRKCYSSFMENILHHEWCEDEQQWVPAEKIDCGQSIQDEDKEDLPTTWTVKRFWTEAEKQLLKHDIEMVKEKWGIKNDC